MVETLPNVEAAAAELNGHIPPGRIKGLMNGSGNVVKGLLSTTGAVVTWPFKKGWSAVKWSGKWGAIGAAIVAGLAVLGIVNSSVRSNRKFDPNQLPEPELPPLVPQQEAQQEFAPPQERVVLGQHTAKVLGQTGMGPNLSQPAIDVDGKPVQDLGAPSRI